MALQHGYTVAFFFEAGIKKVRSHSRSRHIGNNKAGTLMLSVEIPA